MRPPGIIVATVIFILAGIYNVAFPVLFDRALILLVVIGVLCFVTAVGLFAKRKFGFYLTILLFPVMLAQGGLTLYTVVNLVGWNPNYATAAFNGSLVAYIVVLVLAFLLVLDRRAELRPMSVSLPFLGRTPSAATSATSNLKKESKKQIQT